MCERDRNRYEGDDIVAISDSAALPFSDLRQLRMREMREGKQRLYSLFKRYAVMWLRVCRMNNVLTTIGRH